MEELRALYQQEKNVEMQVKVGDEADNLNERIESEANATRHVLKSVYFSCNTSPVSTQVYSINSNTSWTKNCRQTCLVPRGGGGGVWGGLCIWKESGGDARRLA